jgi:perosamine synthetase
VPAFFAAYFPKGARTGEPSAEVFWNFRMSNLQAAVGVAQLERLHEFLQRKRAIGARYISRLKDVPHL